MMILISVILTLAFLVFIMRSTCFFDNHIFIVTKKRAVCQKCGLIKETVKNE